MRRRKFILFMDLAIASSLVILLSSPYVKTTIAYAQAGQVTPKPTDDTYVDSNNTNSNYGGQNDLDIEYWILGTAIYQYVYKDLVWLKFDLSTVPNGAAIDEATLQLYAYVVGETFYVHASSCSDNSWTESTLTYSNMPSYNATSMDTAVVAYNNQWYNWSVVDAIINALNSHHKVLTIVLSEPSPRSFASSILFYSKEAPVNFTDYSPRLTVHWSTAVSEFPTFLILPLAMATTLIAAILHRKKTPRSN